MTHRLESVMLPTDLPGDLPSFLERFGTDQQCRAYLFAARWPEGFGCAACGHGRAWAHKARLIYEARLRRAGRTAEADQLALARKAEARALARL